MFIFNKMNLSRFIGGTIKIKKKSWFLDWIQQKKIKTKIQDIIFFIIFALLIL